MTDASFAAFCTVACSTEKANKDTGFAAYLTGLLCMPLAPVDAETRLRLQLDTPNILWETFLQGAPDIKAGHRLVIGSVKYAVRTVEQWHWFPGADTRPHLILEDTRN